MSDGTDLSGRQVILGDTMGELLYLYGLSQVAFLGGSLVSVGGHNPIEAAVCGQPLVMGPETFNFPDVVTTFSDARCLSLVRSAAALADVVAGYLDAPDERQAAGARAVQVVAANTGTTSRLLELLRSQIRAVPSDSFRIS
jgi:3-deoxy-D-manno-octulosonic-acid transferase